MTTQGAEANRSGSFLQEMIESLFKERGIQTRPWQEVGKNGDMFAPRFLLRNPPYQSLYNRHDKNPKAQTFAGHLFRQFDKGLDIRIVGSWQDERGSTDDKLIALFCNARDAMPEREIWIIAGGIGFRDSAIAWLEHECARATERGDKRLVFIRDIETLRKRIKELVSRPKVLAA